MHGLMRGGRATCPLLYEEVHWRLMSNGWLRLRYKQHERGSAEKYYIGATFDFPDDQITRIDWVGNGPYRVWKNRLKGVEYGVWGKQFNNTVTGHSWAYPEFKGFHGNLNWALIEVADQGSMAVVTEDENLYLRLLTPEEPAGEGNEPKNTHVEFPEGDISFLHAIAPTGTKFIEAQSHGPAGQKYRVPLSGESFETTLFFYFGVPPWHKVTE